MGTAIVAGILVLILAGSITSLRRDKKQGKCSCGGNCGSCKGCRRQ